MRVIVYCHGRLAWLVERPDGWECSCCGEPFTPVDTRVSQRPTPLRPWKRGKERDHQVPHDPPSQPVRLHVVDGVEPVGGPEAVAPIGLVAPRRPVYSSRRVARLAHPESALFGGSAVHGLDVEGSRRTRVGGGLAATGTAVPDVDRVAPRRPLVQGMAEHVARVRPHLTLMLLGAVKAW